MNTRLDPIMQYLQSANELSEFCSQNGWIIPESIEYEILRKEADSVVIYTAFLESIMEGSGCQCDQKSCYGRLELHFNGEGLVVPGVAI